MKQQWSKLMDYPQEFEMDKMYVDLEIVEEGRNDTRKIESYGQLFGFDDGCRKFRKIVLEGDPGTGKTTYVHKLVLDWVNETGEGGKWLNQQFDFIALIRLGSVPHDQELWDYFKALFPSAAVSTMASFTEDYRNHQKILIVLDGYDEMDIKCEHFSNLIQERRIKNNPVPNITLLVTSRISHSNEQGIIQRDILIRSFGFHPNTVIDNFGSKIQNLESLKKIEKNPLAMGPKNYYRNPLFVGMAASIGHITDELFDLMNEFCKTAVERFFLIKPQRGIYTKYSSSDEMWQDAKQFLGNLAFRIIGPGRLAKHVKHLKKHRALSINIGLAWPGKKSGLSFPHRLFAEYFAAVKVAEDPDMLQDYIEDVAYSSFSTLTAKTEKFSGPLSYFLSRLSKKWFGHVQQIMSTDFEVLQSAWLYGITEYNGSFCFSALEKDRCSQLSMKIGSCVNFCPLTDYLKHTTALKELKLRFCVPIHFPDIRPLLHNLPLLLTSLSLDFYFSAKSLYLPTGSFCSPDLAAYFKTTKHLKIFCIKDQSEPYSPYLYDLGKSLPLTLSSLTLSVPRWFRKHKFRTHLSSYLSKAEQLKELSLFIEKHQYSECADIIASIPTTLASLTLSVESLTRRKDLPLVESQQFFEYLTNATELRKLILSGLKGVCTLQLIKLLPQKLSTLSLYDCDLERLFVISLEVYLRQATELKELNVGKNVSIGTQKKFARTLANSSVIRLDLTDCDLQPPFIDAFLTTAEKNQKTFERIELRDVDYDGFSKIDENKTARLIKLGGTFRNGNGVVCPPKSEKSVPQIEQTVPILSHNCRERINR